MLCKVYQMYRGIGKNDKVLCEEKDCRTDAEINKYVAKMAQRYGKKCACVLVEEVDRDGCVICQHIV